jgi:hypothetical protein
MNTGNVPAYLRVTANKDITRFASMHYSEPDFPCMTGLVPEFIFVSFVLKTVLVRDRHELSFVRPHLTLVRCPSALIVP